MAGLTRKGKTYYALFKIAKKTKWVRIGSMPYKLALKKLKELESEFDSTYGASELKPILFTDFSREYLAYSEANKAPKSYLRDQYAIKALAGYFGKHYLLEITNKDIELYKATRLKTVKPRTINIELQCLSNMLKKALEWNYLTKLPTIKRLKETKKAIRFLTLEEMARLIQSASPWLRYILVVLRNSGLRKSELINLKLQDADFDNNVLLIKSTKTNNFNFISMNQELRETLLFLRDNYIAPNSKITPRASHQMEYFFCSPDGKKIGDFKKSFANAVRKAGLVGVTPHTIRHSFASNLVMSGVDITTIQELLGHKNIGTTMIYAHIASEHKAKALDRLTWDKKPQLKIVGSE